MGIKPSHIVTVGTLGAGDALSSHDPKLNRIGAVAVMYLGEIVEIGEARAIFDAPLHPYTRALLDSVMTVSPEAGVPDTRIGHSYPNPLEIPPGCPFHPRCPKAMSVCSTRSPSVTETPQGLVRCHLYSETQAKVA